MAVLVYLLLPAQTWMGSTICNHLCLGLGS